MSRIGICILSGAALFLFGIAAAAPPTRVPTVSGDDGVTRTEEADLARRIRAYKRDIRDIEELLQTDLPKADRAKAEKTLGWYRQALSGAEQERDSIRARREERGGEKGEKGDGETEWARPRQETLGLQPGGVPQDNASKRAPVPQGLSGPQLAPTGGSPMRGVEYRGVQGLPGLSMPQAGQVGDVPVRRRRSRPHVGTAPPRNTLSLDSGQPILSDTVPSTTDQLGPPIEDLYPPSAEPRPPSGPVAEKPRQAGFPELESLSEAEPLAFDSPEAMDLLSEIRRRVQMRDPEGAYNAARQLAQSRPDDAQAQHLLALVLVGMQQFLAAEKPAVLSTKLDPSRAGAFRTLAWVLLNLGRYPEAMEAVSRALMLDGSNAAAYVLRAYIYEQLGDLNSAMRDLDRAASMAPGRFAAALQRAGAGHRLFTLPSRSGPAVAVQKPGKPRAAPAARLIGLLFIAAPVLLLGFLLLRWRKRRGG